MFVQYTVSCHTPLLLLLDKCEAVCFAKIYALGLLLALVSFALVCMLPNCDILVAGWGIGG